MDSNRKKRASAWFYQTVYRDEQILPRQTISAEAQPEAIRAMRAIESGPESWRLSREAIFVRQAEQMAEYEDDYVYNRDVVRYYPTYQSLTDRELRGYFTWRTKWRRGECEKTNLSFAFLYIYELLNQIGVRDPVDGFEKLRAFEREYAVFDDGICPYLKRWLWDYVVCYRLDPVLLADRSEIEFDRHLAVLKDLGNHRDEEIFQAALCLSSYRLDHSRLYAKEPQILGKVIARVLRKMDAYYSAHRKQSLTEDYFGPQIVVPTEMFQDAVFYERPHRESFEYTVDELRGYRCREGKWTMWQPDAAPTRSKKLGELTRTVDSMLRAELGFGSAVQAGLSTKWTVKLIEEEIRACLREQAERDARRISIDFTKLSGIREDASLTREKLIVEEEREEDEVSPLPEHTESGGTGPAEIPLGKEELHLLRSLLCGEDLSWVEDERLLLSVLVDGINEKLYDNFGDSVILLETEPELVMDYAEELKEMVKP